LYSLRISSQATGAEPVTLDEVKAHLKISSTAEDALVSQYIVAARQIAENITGRSLVNTEYALTLNGLYSDHISLPMACPLATATSHVTITYRKTTGDSTTLASTYYTPEHQADTRGFIRLNYESEWPTDVQDSEGAVTITYRAGYSTLASVVTGNVPDAIRQWIMVRAGQMYNHREPIITGTIQTELPRDYVDGLLDRYVVISI
jgi:uncharacterized phiE125 gp8 family phage protein